MPTAKDYADWIVKNQSKKGTPEFQTVATAYEQAKAKEAAEKEPSWMTAISRGVGRIPGQISDIATSIGNIGAGDVGQFVADIAPTPQNIVAGKNRT